MDWKGKINFETRAQVNGDRVFTEGSNEINLLSDSTAVENADLLMIEDSSDGFAKKKVTVVDFLPESPIFGTQFQQTKDDTESSTTSTTFQQKLRMTTTSLPSGSYRIGFYLETRQSNSADAVEWQVELNDTTILATAEQEPDDPNDLFSYGGHDYRTLSGVNTIDIDWRQQRGSTAYIRRARLELWRVS